jgi:hypothetical protein
MDFSELDLLTPQEIRHSLARGIAPRDVHFDQYLSPQLRMSSSLHWSPLIVAVRVGKWLKEHGVRTVVDLGSGPGKFCVATAIVSGAEFTGFEQRPHLVSSAQELAKLFSVHERVKFVRGRLGEDPVPDAEAYYLYNPFGENLFGNNDQIDDTVELGLDQFEECVAATKKLMEASRPGTYFVLYNGFGERPPEFLTKVMTDLTLPNVLSVWRRAGVELNAGRSL